MVNIKEEALKLLREALSELETQKGSVSSGVQKLLRAARIVGEENTSIWCELQLGKQEYTQPLKKFLEATIVASESKSKKAEEDLEKARRELGEEFIKVLQQVNREGFDLLLNESGGGFSSIAFIEETHADLVRLKRGNNGRLYKVNLLRRIDYVRRVAHDKAIILFKKLASSQTPKTTFDYLKEQVDNKLLDLNPELAEKLMITFKSVSSENPEEWSHALTTCRRLIEGLADELITNGRKLEQAQYINRLWAFMDKSIESESNRKLAKSHIDLLGSYLENIHKLTNKGVHTTLVKLEAIKTVFHTYLMLADILEYLEPVETKRTEALNIHTATLDELESVLEVSRTIAKDIIKLRVSQGTLTLKALQQIRGIGQKTVEKAEKLFSFEPMK